MSYTRVDSLSVRLSVCLYVCHCMFAVLATRCVMALAYYGAQCHIPERSLYPSVRRSVCLSLYVCHADDRYVTALAYSGARCHIPQRFSIMSVRLSVRMSVTVCFAVLTARYVTAFAYYGIDSAHCHIPEQSLYPSVCLSLYVYRVDNRLCDNVRLLYVDVGCGVRCHIPEWVLYPSVSLSDCLSQSQYMFAVLTARYMIILPTVCEQRI